MFSNVTWVQLIGPIATLVATTIASICALWIATRVYRTQKQIDVQISHAEEKRRAFKQYFFAATDMHTELRAALYRGADGIGHFRLAEKRLHELYREQEGLALTVGKDAASACRTYTLALLGLREFVSRELFGTDMTLVYADLVDSEAAIQSVLDAREEAVIQARSNVLGSSIGDARADLKELLSQKFKRGELNLNTEKMRAIRSGSSFVSQLSIDDEASQ
jgi:hypothetical protein